jgi:hypothetical protein
MDLRFKAKPKEEIKEEELDVETTGQKFSDMRLFTPSY